MSRPSQQQLGFLLTRPRLARPRPQLARPRPSRPLRPTVELSWDNGLTAHKHHVGCFSAKQWFVFNGQWPIIRCTKLYSKLKKQCKLNYRNKHHNSSLHMKQNSKLFALCEMPLHHRHSAGLDSSHHIMQILCLTGITVQQWWLLHCYPRGS